MIEKLLLRKVVHCALCEASLTDKGAYCVSIAFEGGAEWGLHFCEECFAAYDLQIQGEEEYSEYLKRIARVLIEKEKPS